MPKEYPKASVRLENLGSLITIAETNQCLGYLMPFLDHGVFDATYGRVDVTPEQAEVHNKLLSDAQIKGLLETCKVGQCGSFYLKPDGTVTTFIGTVIGKREPGKKMVVGGRTFRVKAHSDSDLCTVTRIA